MHRLLRAVYEESLELFRADPRVLAAFASGSMGTEREDEHSDVDLDLLIAPEEFDAFDRELPALFAGLGVEPIVWWPERINCATLRNYAILFERQGELLHYDVTIHAALEGVRPHVRSCQAIFDKAGLVQAVEDSERPGYSPGRLRWTIEMYWIYVYIHAKYVMRADVFRLLAAQQELLHCHIHVLRALRPEAPEDWWPITAARVAETPETEGALLSYLGHADIAGVCAALPGQMARFTGDAREACERWGVEYPRDLAARAEAFLAAVLT
jgi:hypothetical protein